MKDNKFLAVVGFPYEFQWEPFSLVEGLFMFKYEYVCFLGSREQIQFSSSSVSLPFSISSISSLMCWMNEAIRLQLEAVAGHLRGWLAFDNFLRRKSHFSFIDSLRNCEGHSQEMRSSLLPCSPSCSLAVSTVWKL